jgi:hypothetical protein
VFLKITSHPPDINETQLLLNERPLPCRLDVWLCTDSMTCSIDSFFLHNGELLVDVQSLVGTCGVLVDG